MSIAIMLRDLAAFYNAIVHGTKPDLPELGIQASDHMAWLAELEKHGRFAQKQTWWRERFSSPDSGRST